MTTQNRSSFLRRHGTRLALSVLVAVLFWIILRGGGLPVIPDTDAFRSVRWWTVPGYAAILAALTFVRALRTRHLLRPVARVRLREILAVSFIGFLAIFVLPFRLGEVVRPALYHSKGHVPFATATGTIGAERIIDGLVLMIILAVALPLGIPLSPLPDHIGKLPIPVVAVPAAAYTSLFVFVGAFLAMALFYWRRELAWRLTGRVFGFVSPRLGQFLASQVEKMSQGFRFLPSPRLFLPYLAETLVYWALAALGMWLLAWGCGLHTVSFAQACTFMGVLGVGIIAPGAPGYFGAFQGSLYAGLALYLAEPTVLGPGAVFVFLLYVCQLSMMAVHAALGALIDRDLVSSAALEAPASDHA